MTRAGDPVSLTGRSSTVGDSLDRLGEVLLAHDYLNQRGGAERVVLAISGMWPGATIYTSLYRRESTFEGFAEREVRTSPLDRLPFDRHSAHAWYRQQPARADRRASARQRAYRSRPRLADDLSRGAIGTLLIGILAFVVIGRSWAMTEHYWHGSNRRCSRGQRVPRRAACDARSDDSAGTGAGPSPCACRLARGGCCWRRPDCPLRLNAVRNATLLAGRCP